MPMRRKRPFRRNRVAILALLNAPFARAGLLPAIGRDEVWVNDRGAAQPLSPTASFEAYDSSLPNVTIAANSRRVARFPRGRHEPMPTYAGMKMWTSRGRMDCRRAVLAMLGDGSAYYESPMFTAYRLFALAQIHQLSTAVFPSVGDGGWQSDAMLRDSYTEFWPQVTARAFDPEFFGRFPTAATEAEAVALAKALVDDFFASAAPEDFAARFLSDEDFFEDPHFLAYSSLNYRSAMYEYGMDDVGDSPAALLALAPAARRRGLDGGYWKLALDAGCFRFSQSVEDRRVSLRARDGGGRFGSDSDSGSGSVGGGGHDRYHRYAAGGRDGWRGGRRGSGGGGGSTGILDGDAAVDGALSSPASQEGAVFFARPALTAVLTEAAMTEAVRDNFWEVCECDESDFGEILTPGYQLPADIVGLEFSAHSFYRVEFLGRPHVAVLSNDARCVIHSAANAVSDKAVEGGRFYFCGEDECTEDRSYCGATPLVPLTPPEPVPVVGVIYPGARTEAAEEERSLRADAQSLLDLLNGGTGSDGPVAAAVAAAAGKALPPWLLTSLQDIHWEFDGGNDGGGGGGGERAAAAMVAAAAVFVGVGGEAVNVSLDAAARRERPSAGEVLRARAAAGRDGQ
ncbi:unnamed protein product [Phaeothamnion confervicola]